MAGKHDTFSCKSKVIITREPKLAKILRDPKHKELGPFVRESCLDPSWSGSVSSREESKQLAGIVNGFVAGEI